VLLDQVTLTVANLKFPFAKLSFIYIYFYGRSQSQHLKLIIQSELSRTTSLKLISSIAKCTGYGNGNNLRGISSHQHVNWGRQQLHHEPYGGRNCEGVPRSSGRVRPPSILRRRTPAEAGKPRRSQVWAIQEKFSEHSGDFEGMRRVSDLERGEGAEVLRVTQD
jgi:hypothetical protein